MPLPLLPILAGGVLAGGGFLAGVSLNGTLSIIALAVLAYFIAKAA